MMGQRRPCWWPRPRPDDQKTFKRIGVGKDQMLKMENEMASLQRQYKLVEQTYGQDVLNLVLAKGYLTKILANEAVAFMKLIKVMTISLMGFAIRLKMERTV